MALAAGAVWLACLIVANCVEIDAPQRPTEAWVRARIARDPLDLTAVRALGLALNRRGRTDAAERFLSFVATQTWRDIPTLVWLVPRRIRQGDFVNATADADALMRQNIDDRLREPLIKTMIAAAGDDGARPALVTRLEARPWWRESFLPRLGVAGDIQGARAVLRALAKGRAPASDAEYAPLINRLVETGAYDDALDDRTALSGRPKAVNEPLRNGDFAAPADPTAFGWSSAVGVGGQSAVEAAPDAHGEMALRVDYDGFSTPALPRQLLVLRPGRYRLGWREWRSRDSPRRIDWTVHCADTGAVVAQDVSTYSGSGWVGRTLTIAVPIGGCRGQWLVLAPSPGERRDPATVWYTGFRLNPPP